MDAEGDGERILETHLLRLLSHLRCRDDPGVGGVLSSPHELGLGQLLSAVLLHGLGLQLGDAGVLGSENLGRVGLLRHLGGGRFLVLAGVSFCREKGAEAQPCRARGSKVWGEGTGSLHSWTRPNWGKQGTENQGTSRHSCKWWEIQGDFMG